MAVEAVIWDFGGVFTTSPFEAFNRLEAERGLPQDLVRRVNSTNPDTNAWALFERNEIDAAGFDALFLEESTALGHPLRGADVLPKLNGRTAARGWWRRSRPARRASRSAASPTTWSRCTAPARPDGREVGRRMALVMPLFDAIIESSKAGVRKPDPTIYLMMCELLAVSPRRCVYLDDLGINCKPAAGLGMTAIKVVHRGPDPGRAVRRLHRPRRSARSMPQEPP